MREVQRATLVSHGNGKSSMTIFDALPIPVHPTTFTIPTFTSEASNGDAKELVVRRMIDSRISGHQISVRFFVQHLPVSITEARVTPWRVCKKEKKTTRKRDAWRRDPQTSAHRQHQKEQQDLEVQVWTHRRCLAPESCSDRALVVSSPYSAIQKNS